MANYNLVTTGTFQPFTYNELMAPIQEIEKSYADTESTMTDLESKVSLIKNTLPEDSEEYRMANSFLNDLNKGIEDLQNNGVSSTTSRKMLALNRKYNTELLPVAQKTEMLKKAQDIRSQILAKDPTAIFVNDLPSINDINLGESIDNTVVPSESMIDSAYKNALSEVLSTYDGKNEFTRETSLKDKVLKTLGDNYNLDLNDSKYSQLRLQVNNAIDSGILKGVEDRKSNYLTTRNAGLQYETLLSKLRTQQAEEMLQPYVYNAKTRSYDKNPLIFNKDGSLTELGKSSYSKKPTSSSGSDFYILDEKGERYIINPRYLNEDGSYTDIGKAEAKKRGLIEDEKSEEIEVPKIRFSVDPENPTLDNPEEGFPAGIMRIDPNSETPIEPEHLNFIRKGYNMWYYPGDKKGRGKRYYYAHPSLVINPVDEEE